jgi:hypothetical protein
MRKFWECVFCIIAITVGVAVVGFCLFLIVWFAAIFTGQREYDYRCKEGVTESRAEIFGVAFGSFRPLDGDAVASSCRP